MEDSAPTRGITVRSGLVKMLSVDCAARTGAPTLTLYFVDDGIQPAEFSMDVKSACRLFYALVNANKQVHWEWRKPRDSVASEERPDVSLDVSITECGMMRDVSIRLDTESGNAAFTIGLRRGKVGKLEFTLDPAVCLSLMKALFDLHEHFGWTRGAGDRRQLH